MKESRPVSKPLLDGKSMGMAAVVGRRRDIELSPIFNGLELGLTHGKSMDMGIHQRRRPGHASGRRGLDFIFPEGDPMRMGL